MATPRRVEPRDPNAPGAGGTGSKKLTPAQKRAAARKKKEYEALVAQLQRAQQAKQANKAIYIGVDAGSDLETYGNQVYNTGHAADPSAKTGPASFASDRGFGFHRKPLYKVGYLHSKDFARELGDMNPDAIYQYQQYLNQAGLLDKFIPGQLDKPTRAAFKELVTEANQTGTTWQQSLNDTLSAGGVYGDGDSGRQAPDAFVAQLDDPVTLRATFQRAAQDIYGGNLPDEEINGMVEAYRTQQLAKQQAAYNASLAASDGGTPGSVTSETDPTAFITEHIRSAHPDQVAKVEFSGTLSNALSSLSKPGGGLM